MDIVLSLLGLIASFWLYVIIMMVIDNPSPVFFIQKRVGNT
ncbi:sugar transferase [Blautia sp.]